MADRVPNADIEDVLSSIRRLVSIDDQDASGHTSALPEQAGEPLSALISNKKEGFSEPDPDDRFVLSPSLRIDNSADAPSEQHSSCAPEDAASNGPGTEHDETSRADDDKDPSGAETLGLSEWQIDADASSSADAQEAADQGALDPDEDGASDGSDDAVDWARLGDQVMLSKMSGSLDDPSTQTDADEPPKTLEGVAPGSSELEARIAEVEAAVAARDDQWEPDGSEPEADAPPPIASLPWLRPKDHAGARPAEPEERAEKDGAPSTSESAVTPRSGDQLPVPVDQSQKEPNDHWYGEDTVIDEAALRDLVSEIVRQELQGSLGERITRNVRKLVRREIHRAMMGQDLD